MGNGLRTQARRVLLQQVVPAYHQASGSQKQHILEEFVTATGYARKYAQWLLNHSEEVLAPPTALRRRYGPEVEEALVLAWKTLNRICAKRLIPFLPSIVEALEAEGHLELDEQQRVPLPHVVSPATFDQAMRAGFPRKVKESGAMRMATRDRALLWVLFETGMTVSEVCALRVADLDLQAGLLHVRGKGGQERLMPLGVPCLSHLRAYLKQMEPTTRSGLARRRAGGDPLFGSREKEPLTRNGVTMVFARFRTRARLTDTPMSPQILRHSFALRYLQAGGNPRGLQVLMGYGGMAPVRQSLRWQDQLFNNQT